MSTNDQSLQSCIQQQSTASTTASCSVLLVDHVSPDVQHTNTSGSFASLVQLAAHDPAAFSNTRNVKKPNKLVVGKSVNNTRLQSVATKRTVDLFISRLDPNTADGELIECVKSVINDNDAVNLVVAGNFNCQVGSRFYDSFLRFVGENKLQLTDQRHLNDVFTYCNDSATAYSWIDHIVCSHSVNILGFKLFYTVSVCLFRS